MTYETIHLNNNKFLKIVLQNPTKCNERSCKKIVYIIKMGFTVYSNKCEEVINK